MSFTSYSPLLNLLWRTGYFVGRDLVDVSGESVGVVAEGVADDRVAGLWRGAEIVVDGERRRGEVVIGEETGLADGAVLRMVVGYAPQVLGIDDRLVPQVCWQIEPGLVERFDLLRAGAGSCECATLVAGMEPLRRAELLSGLLVERLRRKTARVADIFEQTGKDWNQTFHVLLLQAMGGDRNREAFTELALRATSAMVSRERSSLTRVEALLLGTAGFLFGEGGNSENAELEGEFRHLAAKYSIVPLKPAQWNLAKLYPANHPVVRLTQIAALLCKKDFMLDGVLACRAAEDVEGLFTVSSPQAKSIGRAKARLVGINLAAPLMFAYGKETGSEHLCERSLDLLGAIPAEKNARLDGWYGGGCKPESSFDSQALLELAGEYCARGACAECRVGRSEIKKAMKGLCSTINA